MRRIIGELDLTNAFQGIIRSDTLREGYRLRIYCFRAVPHGEGLKLALSPISIVRGTDLDSDSPISPLFSTLDSIQRKGALLGPDFP